MAQLKNRRKEQSAGGSPAAKAKPAATKVATASKPETAKPAAAKLATAKSAAGYATLINYYHEMRPKLVTLDIFDTVLLRDDISERRRFFEIAKLQEELLAKSGQPVAAIDLLRARLAAAELAYRFTNHVNGSREASVDEIYIAMIAMLRIKRSLYEAMLDIELRFEARSLVLNEDISRFIKTVQQDDVQVVLLTDMYLRAEDVRRIFTYMNVPALVAELDLISSAETKLPKSNGTAFALVAERFKLSTSDIMHVGDNDAHEIWPARRAGVNALHLPRPRRLEMARKADLVKLAEELGL